MCANSYKQRPFLERIRELIYIAACLTILCSIRKIIAAEELKYRNICQNPELIHVYNFDISSRSQLITEL